jgi:hypothetical protein
MSLNTPNVNPRPTSLLHFLLRGSLGFAVVSVAGFAVWAFAGRFLAAHVGAAGLYLACAIVFIALSGLVLHPLVRGPGSLGRFYKIFIPAFGAYAIAWSAVWFALRFGTGEWLGSLAGSIVLTGMIGRGLKSYRSIVKVCVIVFVLHSAGYFFVGRLMQWLAVSMAGGLKNGHVSALPKLCWGLLYGLGVGAGLGYAFFTFQNESLCTVKAPNADRSES